MDPSPSNEYRAYIAGGNREVEGWFAPIAAALVDAVVGVQRQRGVSGHVAEIGVHHGRMFIALALSCGAGERAVAIDLFDQQELNVDHSGRGNLEAFRANVARWMPHGPEPVVLAVDSSTLDGGQVSNAAGGPIRLFSIDGGHTAELTEGDLRTAIEAVGAGGVVVLDDYFNPEWPGVAEGAHAVLREGRLAPFVIGGNKVFLASADDAPGYFDALCRSFGVDTGTDKYWCPTTDERFRYKLSSSFGHEVLVVVSRERPPPRSRWRAAASAVRRLGTRSS